MDNATGSEQASEQEMLANRRCIKEVANKKTITLENMPEIFTFDYIAGEESHQHELFEDIG